jgi:signal transduction histidine kinase
MISPESRLFCPIGMMPESNQEQQRLATLMELGLLETGSVPIFEEATQTAAHFLKAPICILGLLDRDRQWLKSAIGLSRMGLMNELASSRQLPRHEAFCSHVVDSRQVLMIPDTATHPTFATSVLTQRYGIQAYLGAPLLAANGCCLGTLAVMTVSSHEFTRQDIEILELIARWCMSEFERDRLLKQQLMAAIAPSDLPQPHNVIDISTSNEIKLPSINAIKVNLITQITQELCTPLTSILGMASILNSEIYAPLTSKQKKYTDIVLNSGQYLLSLVNEILELGRLDDSGQPLKLDPVDIEMLCQQVLTTLGQVTQQCEQRTRLTVEPGSRTWLLDKDKVRQILYHLIFSIIQSSSADSTIHIHVSRKRYQLSLAVWTSHPWLGEGIPQSVLAKQWLPQLPLTAFESDRFAAETDESDAHDNAQIAQGNAQGDVIPEHCPEQSRFAANQMVSLTLSQPDDSRQGLGLILSRHLTELHGGQIALQGTPEQGYRYVISLPQQPASIDEE